MNQGDTESPKQSAGAQLTEAREQAGWSVVQAADRLHLDVATVKALEAGQFEALGGAVYARGHLRRYAELLGLPMDQVEAAYLQSNPPKRPPDLKRSANLFRSGAHASALRPRTVAIGGAVAALVALVWWAMHVPHAVKPVPVAANAPASSAVVPAAVPVVPEPANLATPVTANPQVDLGLKFRQGSWAEIYDASGTRLFSEFGSAGTERRLNGTAPLSILLGNASAVSLELDGHPVALGDKALGGSGVRFSLDGGGKLSDVQPAHAATKPVATAPARSHSSRP
jgi:cytoskeleton protein RodZ